MDFEKALFTQLQQLEQPSIWQSRLIFLIASKATCPVVVKALELHVRTFLGVAPTATVDWSSLPGTINWAGLLAFIEQLLPLLLPLIGLL